MKEDPRVFYTDDRKRLAPAFDSHMDRLQEWRRDVTLLHKWALCLDDRLREPANAGPSCRPTIGGTADVGKLR